ncbi:4Fe-4S dicluster domain-containing protein [Leptospira langatensis]|uniref:Ferredoxin n=1 Tax=Leptospira langatensis TaxID=2484983 RepID=A0A5F1ZP67_9LEPT|nr:4Fe-4S dicluster domain-containing protein [Leptospira langatensis]TGK01924.1 4Fe-4S dicluster domain-containing protein [Leptospira langatensis]TGL39279.1 4Fe-4S dicluster domain-containing protein [Leptospira langatensis]
MAYVVTPPCIGCKITYCAAACPVEAFREGEDYLLIDPDICIHCNDCLRECPVNAIFPEDEVPVIWKEWIGINATESKKLPIIRDLKTPLLDRQCNIREL